MIFIIRSILTIHHSLHIDDCYRAGDCWGFVLFLFISLYVCLHRIYPLRNGELIIYLVGFEGSFISELRACSQKDVKYIRVLEVYECPYLWKCTGYQLPRCFIDYPSQFYHYRTCLFTIFHVSKLYTVALCRTLHFPYKVYMWNHISLKCIQRSKNNTFKCWINR